MTRAFERIMLEWRDYRRGLSWGNRGEDEAFDALWERARRHSHLFGDRVLMTDVFVAMLVGQEEELRELHAVAATHPSGSRAGKT